MGIKKRFADYYKNGYMPWVHKNPDFNLVEMVERWPIKPCKTLEMGCGTGVDAIWLASQEFDVTACDVTEIAIEIAKKNMPVNLTNCQFHVLDCMNDSIPGAPFEFIFDRGYFHSNRTARSRKKLAKKIAETLKPGGLWLNISGSYDAPERETGPPRMKAKDIIYATESYFKLLSLNATHFGSDQEDPARAWVSLFRKR
jgi:SAM-dependent methyltransferase